MVKRNKTILFIDAGYYSKIVKHFGKGKYLKIDLIKFAKHLAVKQDLWLEHIFYYTAPPFQGSEPTKEEAKRKAKYDSFVQKMKENKLVTVREGRLQKINGNFVQKGVDTLLTMDLTTEPIERSVKEILLLACDTDFVPILNKIREKHRIKVNLYFYTDRKRNSAFSMSNHLYTACDMKILLSKEDFVRNTKNK